MKSLSPPSLRNHLSISGCRRSAANRQSLAPRNSPQGSLCRAALRSWKRRTGVLSNHLIPAYNVPQCIWPVLLRALSRTHRLCASSSQHSVCVVFQPPARPKLHGEDVINRFERREEKCIHSNQSGSWWGLLYPRCIWTGAALLERMPKVHSCQRSLAQPLHRRWVSVIGTSAQMMSKLTKYISI